MKIAMLTTSYPKWPGEGTAPFIEEIAAGVAARGHEVHMVLPYRHDLRLTAQRRGVWLHPYRYAPTRALEVWGYAAGLRGDRDLKLATLAATPLALTQGLRALLAVTASGDFDIIHGHWALPNGVVAAAAALIRGRPLVLSLHGSDVFFAEQSAPTSWLARWAARRAAMITACSGDLAARLVALGADPARMTTVPYGVDAQQFAPTPAADLRAELGIRPDQPLLVWVSRMVYKKGLHVLLDALPAVRQAFPDTVLLLGGYGDQQAELAAQAARLGLSEAVRFPGAIPHTAVNHYWNAADLVPVPAVHDGRGNVDGLPNMLLEAMSAGRPIVASGIAGIPQVITDGEHGLLVPEGDPAALAAAIIRLLADRALADRLGQAARQRVERELLWPHLAARIEQIYLQATDPTTPPLLATEIKDTP